MLTATNISALSAQKIEYLNTQDVLISINIPNRPKHNLSIDRKNSRVLTVEFWDVTANGEREGELVSPIDGETAIKIIKFVEFYKHKNFIVHCQAGISRSAAVCMFIHLLYDHKLKDDFWRVSRPNPYVLGKLFLLHAQLYQENGVIDKMDCKH